MSAHEAPADAPTANATRRELAVARALDQARSRAENRVELFLDAARELMATSSVEFTVQEVVERSGQSLRTFYQYFAGKHELLLALFEESGRSTAEHLREVTAGERDAPRLPDPFTPGSHLISPTAKGKAAKTGPPTPMGGVPAQH